MGLQSSESPHFENFETPNLGVLEQNDIWVQGSWPSIKNIIGGRWWLPPSPSRGESCEFVFTRGLSVHQLCTNQFVVWFVWIIDLLVIRPSSHPGTPAHLSTPEVLWTKERTLIPYPFSIFTLDSQLSLPRSLRVHQFASVLLCKSLVYYCCHVCLFYMCKQNVFMIYWWLV
jgi:hypothetical protein